MPAEMKSEVTFEVDARSLAKAFCDMGSNEQAEFFSHVRFFSSQWEDGTWVHQAHWICEDLSEDGRYILRAFLAYLSPGEKAPNPPKNVRKSVGSTATRKLTVKK